MEKIQATVTLTGASGRKYVFVLYTFSNYDEVGGRF